jgi:RNA polymerase sigma factor (sigma-70 family)
MNRTPRHDVDRISCELIERYRAGDQTAFDELAKLHAPLIEKVVISMVGMPTPDNFHWRQDLRQEGLLALARAVRPDKYDPDRVSFGTYLFTGVFQRVHRHAIQYEGLITTPAHYTNPDLELHARKIRKKSKAAGLYSAPDTDLCAVTLDRITAQEDVVETVARNEALEMQRAALQEAMEILDDRQRDIVLSVANNEPMANIGKRYGITREAIRQLHVTAIGQLKRHAKRQGHTVNPDLEKRAKYKRQWLRESRERAQQTRALRLKPLTVTLAAQRSKEV